MNDFDRHLPEISAGDPDAFARWVSGAEPRLRDSLATFAAAVDVEAVLQEALLRVWNVAPRFAPDGSPNGLLRLAIRIARNLAVSELRSRGRVAPLDEADLDRAVEGRSRTDLPGDPDPLLRRLILECLTALPTQPAKALRERLTADGTEPDAVLAARLRMRLNTFLQNVTRARRGLITCLRDHGADVEVIS